MRRTRPGSGEGMERQTGAVACATRPQPMERGGPLREPCCRRPWRSVWRSIETAEDDHENVDRDRHRPDARARLVSRARAERLSRSMRSNAQGVQAGLRRRPELRPVREQLPGPLPAVPGELPVLTVTGTGP